MQLQQRCKNENAVFFTPKMRFMATCIKDIFTGAFLTKLMIDFIQNNITLFVYIVLSQFILVFCLFFLSFLADFAHIAIDKRVFYGKFKEY